MKILVTGGAGFIGSYIVDELIKVGYEIGVVDNLSTGKRSFVNEKARFWNVDILDVNMNQVFEEFSPDIVIHQAAQIDVQKSIQNPLLDARINILGSLSVLEACKKYSVKKIIYSSSAAVYGDPIYLGIDEKHPVNPLSNYGVSKYVPENYIVSYSRLYGIDYTILRYANVYGNRQDAKGEGGVVSIFFSRMLRGELPVIFGDGYQTRDFVYVKDVVSANVAALSRGSKGIFNIGTGIQTTILDLVEALNAELGLSLRPIFEKAKNGDIMHSFYNIEHAKANLNWFPIHTFKEGLKDLISISKVEETISKNS